MMNRRIALFVSSIAMLTAGLLTTAHYAAASGGPTVKLGSVSGRFYDGSNFGFSTPGTELFAQQFSAIDFNPPTGFYGGDPTNAPACSNATGVTEATRPFTDVIPLKTGKCSLQVAQGNGFSAGANPAGFEASFSSQLNVSGAGNVSFTVSSDDGFVMGVGPLGSHQPTYVSGPQASLPATTFPGNYPALAGDNTGHFPDQIYTIVINFPAAGKYPLELNYSEDGTQGLSLTFGTGVGLPLVSSFAVPLNVPLLGKVQGKFYANPNGTDPFIAPTSKVLLAKQFTAIDFDPPSGATSGDPKNSPACTPAVNVDEFTQPFTNVVPNYSKPKAKCVLQKAAGGAFAAFQNPLAFYDTMVSSITVKAAGNQVFVMSTDDGFLVGFGASKHKLPTFVAGAQSGFNPGDKTFAKHLGILFGDNSGHGPTQIYAFDVHFPAAGTYPMEIDHSENGVGTVSLTFGTAPSHPLVFTPKKKK